jgi:hypothetical protein
MDVAAATPAVLFLGQRDLAEMALDGDPATAVDWGNGAWQRYEDVVGTAGDTGGGSCPFKPYIAPAAGTAPPAAEAYCREGATAPPPPPPPPPPSQGGGGGDGSGLLLLLLGLMMSTANRRREWQPRP